MGNIISAIIPCAGRGSRMTEYTKSLFPKSMLPILNKPIISWIIDHLIAQNIKDFYFVINKDDQTIIQYVHSTYNRKINAHFIVQDIPLGPLYAVHLSLINMPVSPILIILGDGIYDDEFYFSEDFLLFKNVSDYQRWCLVQTDNNGFIKKFFDKPDIKPPTSKALVGVYYLSDSLLFKESARFIIDTNKLRNGEFQLSSALELYNINKSIKAKETTSWLDCGSPDLYEDAKKKLSIKSRHRLL